MGANIHLTIHGTKITCKKTLEQEPEKQKTLEPANQTKEEWKHQSPNLMNLIRVSNPPKTGFN